MAKIKKIKHKPIWEQRQKQFGKIKFPSCIGTFPDEYCQTITKENQSEECKNCPKYKSIKR